VGFRTADIEGLLDTAVETAAGADAALVFVGTTREWETEGWDRASLALPGRQEELVRRVAAANPRTVVVINAGAPVDLSCCDDAAAVMQCWFGGEEMASAVADILTGVAEPGGRLPTTVPLRLEHSPSHDNFAGENGELRYGEGLFMGYRGFEHRCIRPRYAFGHGLGYTSFELGQPVLSTDSFTPGGELTVSVEVRNVGTRPGSAVVQCYVAPRAPRLARPPKELKAFGRIHLEPGQSGVVELRLHDRSFAYWDPGQDDWSEVAGRFTQTSPQLIEQERRVAGWQVDPGTYDILIGRSSADITGHAQVAVVQP
jgi:beta-glucosidase